MLAVSLMSILGGLVCAKKIGGITGDTLGANTELFTRRAAVYVDKILKGSRPGDLPIEQPTAFDLVVNLKTAGSLGLTVPPSVLQQATDVIQ